MAERLTILPHDFEFTDEARSLITLVGTRLDPKTSKISLVADNNGDFPTTGDQYVVCPLYKPKAVRQWLGFQVDIDHVFEIPNVPLTSVAYRLSDGATQFYWDAIGLVWTPTTTLWSSEADIASNIASFPPTARQIQIIVKLATSDKRFTPFLRVVRLAWKGKVEAFEDILFRSLVPFLRSTRMITDFAIKIQIPGGTKLDVLAAVKSTGMPLNVVDVDGIFNNNIDPDHYNNLLASYNQNTGIATLATAVPVGQFAFLRLVLQPQVAVESTAQDYIEVEKVPALQVVNIQAVDSQPLSVEVGVANKATGDIIVIKPPYRFNLRFTMIALTPGGVDLMRMLRAVVELMENNPMISSTATDEQYRLWMIDEFSDTTVPASNNLRSQQAVFEIMDVLSFEKPAIFTKAVRQVNLNF